MAPSDVLPLDGVRVIDFTQFVAGPHCTLWLASMGAEVIKIESPGRPDPFRLSLLKGNAEPTLNNSPVFVATNLMKRSCCIDIADPEGQRLCHDLVGVSDVVVANFRPGVLEGFNLGYATLREINPAIVMTTVTGYGYTGDYAAFQALGPNIHAFSGLSASTGYPGGPPEPFFGTYADVIAGQAAALSTIAALLHRDATGEGTYVDTAMSEAVVAVAPEAALRASLLAPDGNGDLRRGNDEPGYSPHGCYPCAGPDRWLAVASFDELDWQRLVHVLELDECLTDPRFASRPARWEHRVELDRVMADATRSWDAAELADLLQRAGVAAAPVRTAEDVLGDEQLLADGFIAAVTQSELGPAQLPTLPWRIRTGSGSSRPIGPAPDFGEGTRDILQRLLGLTDGVCDDLYARGIVA
jgi:crotonobetainyl-CoA:carnitine CoA-transferase CaiB-like acyl-CoA transferase